MMGSKRLSALANTIGGLQDTIDRQDERLREIETARTVDAARIEALQVKLDEAGAMLDASQAANAQLAARLAAIEADTEAKARFVSDSIAVEQSQRAALERSVAKLDRRLDAQAEEARVTATALLQRMRS